MFGTRIALYSRMGLWSLYSCCAHLSNSRTHVAAVFLLFFSTSQALADWNSVKEFAQRCHKGAVQGLVITGQKSAQKAHEVLQKIQEIDPKTAAIAAAKFPLRTSWELSKGSVYPLWAMGKGTYEYIRSKEGSRKDAVKEVLKNRWKNDKGAMIAASILWGLQQTTGLTVNQFHKLTSDFDEDDDEDGLVVVIDNFADDPYYSGAGDYVTNNLYKKKYGERLVLLKNIALKDIPAELKKLTELHGKPIKKVDYYGHGLVGETIGHGGSFNDYVSYSSYQAGKPIFDPSTRLPRPLSGTNWDGPLFSAKLDPSIFGKNAKVRFNSCFAGNGPEGELFARTIANSWLRNGGKVYTSNVQILPSAGEIFGLKTGAPIPPQFIRSVTDHLVPIRGAVTAYTLLYEIPTYVHNSDRVKGPFLTDSRVTIHNAEGESALQDQFEKAWASEIGKIEGTAIFNIYDGWDLMHYAPLRKDASDAAKNVEYMRWGSDKTTQSLKFKSKSDAEEYLKNLEIDREVLEEPRISGTDVILRSKSNVDQVLEHRRFLEKAAYGDTAKKRLEDVYQKAMRSPGVDKAKVERLYDQYRALLPLYLFSSHDSHNPPKKAELYDTFDRFKSR